jgi:hypothetical protein
MSVVTELGLEKRERAIGVRVRVGGPDLEVVRIPDCGRRVVANRATSGALTDLAGEALVGEVALAHGSGFICHESIIPETNLLHS